MLSLAYIISLYPHNNTKEKMYRISILQMNKLRLRGIKCPQSQACRSLQSVLSNSISQIFTVQVNHLEIMLRCKL